MIFYGAEYFFVNNGTIVSEYAIVFSEQQKNSYGKTKRI